MLCKILGGDVRNHGRPAPEWPAVRSSPGCTSEDIRGNRRRQRWPGDGDPLGCGRHGPDDGPRSSCASAGGRLDKGSQGWTREWRQRPRPAVTGVQGGAGAPPAVRSCQSVGHGACGQPRKPELRVSTESALWRFPFSQRCPSDGREHSKHVPAQGQPAQSRGRARRRGGV